MAIPSKTRRDVLMRCGNCCEECQSDVSECGKLEMHHVVYDEWVSGKLYDIRGRERPEHIEALCRNCHHARHRDPLGNFYLLEDEKVAEWWWYYND